MIGADVPKELKTSYRAMLNNELMINGIPYKVIGGVKKVEAQSTQESPDDEVYVPLMTASARIFGSKNLRSIMVKIPNDANVEEAMLYIEVLCGFNMTLVPVKRMILESMIGFNTEILRDRQLLFLLPY